jgi:glutamate/tyrosine decarboxylase-like PLP-dependent enzyme
MMRGIRKLAREIRDYFAGVGKLRVTPRVSPAEIRRHLAERFDFQRPQALEGLIAEVSKLLRAWTLHTAHPRYFGLFNPGVRPAGVAADALVALYNPQMAAWSHSPIGNELERHTLRWLAPRFGLDPERSAAHFTSGGAEANLTGVLVALTHAFPDYGERGLRALPAQPVFYVSEEAHHSFHKVAHLAGLGREALRTVPVDEELKMDLGELERRIAADRAAGQAPFLVVGTAGTTSAGVIDPLAAQAGLCAREKLWLHVDAAWGGAAVFSPKLRMHLAGIERADSLTCDAHKWLAAPMGAGMFFCRHPESVARTFRVSASYMPDPTRETVDPYVTSIQWSRRFIGLKVFMTLAELGEQGLIRMIETQAALGELLRDRLRRAGWRIVNRTPLPVVCFTHARLEEGELSVRELVERVYERGQVWVSEVLLGGRLAAVRACITNYRTRPADVEALVEELGRCLEAR